VALAHAHATGVGKVRLSAQVGLHVLVQEPLDVAALGAALLFPDLAGGFDLEFHLAAV
jgi:hypothetical protein